MKLSRFTIFLPREEFSWAVNTMSRTVLRVPHDVADFFSTTGQFSDRDIRHRFGDTAATLLKGAEYIVEDSVDEIMKVGDRVEAERDDQTTFGMVIAPTLGCNCSCHYCFEGQVRTPVKITDSSAIVEIAREKLPGRKTLTVQWFGGEPLLNSDFVFETSSALKRLCSANSVGFSASIVTNGVHLDRKTAMALAECGVTRCQLTLEGSKKLHDRVRFESDRKGTFDTIISNIGRCHDLLDISLRVHVTPYNHESVFQLIDFLGSQNIGPAIKEIYFAPIFDYTTGEDAPQFAHEDKRYFTARSFAALEPLLYRHAKNQALPLPDPFDEGFDVCTAVRKNTVVIGADGALHKCYFDLGDRSQAFGALRENWRKPEILEIWEHFQIPRDEECGNCRLLPVCLGGCSKKWSKDAPKETICDSMRYNLDEMIDVFYG